MRSQGLLNVVSWTLGNTSQGATTPAGVKRFLAYNNGVEEYPCMVDNQGNPSWERLVSYGVPDPGEHQCLMVCPRRSLDSDCTLGGPFKVAQNMIPKLLALDAGGVSSGQGGSVL